MNYLAISALAIAVLFAFGVVGFLIVLDRQKTRAEQLKREASEAADRALDVATLWYKCRRQLIEKNF